MLSLIHILIASLIGGSVKLKNGIINGGLVGVILGLIVGAVSYTHLDVYKRQYLMGSINQ